MSTYQWAKLWIDVLDDPKMGFLDDHLWRRFFELVLMAKDLDDGGFLPLEKHIAWRLRVSVEEIERDLQALANTKDGGDDLGLVQLVEGRWHIVSFCKRQETPMEDAERKRRQRERDRRHELDTPVSRDVTEEVTTRDIDKTRQEDQDKTRDLESGADAPSADAEPAEHTTFEEWREEVKSASNRQAVLRRMIDVLYPGLDPPAFGYIGKTARSVGGAGRLAELLWQHSTRPPTGDLMAYLLSVHKGKRNNGGGAGKSALGAMMDLAREKEEKPP